MCPFSQESAQTALGWIRSNAALCGIPETTAILDGRDIHVHFPAGATPKDGPSAGVAIACALVSLLSGRLVRHDVAMTGELSLVGVVLPVGGIKEKVLAARRNRIPNVILPADNKKDLPDIPKQALKDLNIHFVEHMQEVLDLVLLEAPEQRQRDLDNDSGGANDEDRDNE